MLTYAVVLALAGSSAVVLSTPAAADSCGSTYSSAPPMSMTITSPDIERGARARIVVRVATYGNLEPTGRVSVLVVRGRGGFSWKGAKKYDGSRVRFRTPALERRGRYTVRARFDADPAPCVYDSNDTSEFRVTRPG